MIGKLVVGAARQVWRATGRLAGRRSGKFSGANTLKSRVKSTVRHEVDLIRRPGRAHGYETPKIGKPRTRAQGHAVYKKSLGVPGFKTREHHAFLSQRARNRLGAVVVAGAETARGFVGVAHYNKKAEKLNRSTRRLDASTAKISRGIAGRKKDQEYWKKAAFGPRSKKIDFDSPTSRQLSPDKKWRMSPSGW